MTPKKFSTLQKSSLGVDRPKSATPIKLYVGFNFELFVDSYQKLPQKVLRHPRSTPSRVVRTIILQNSKSKNIFNFSKILAYDFRRKLELTL